MFKSKYIESLQNPLIKKLLLLKEKKRGRKKTGLFVLEGIREFQMALKGNYSIETVFFYKDILAEEKLAVLLKELANSAEIIEVSKEVYQRIAYREKTEGLLALAYSKTHALEGLSFKRKNPLVLVMESPEKPGNLGAMLRTADAADVDAVIVANPKGDLYNPNVIRSSVGCLFTVPIGVGSNLEVIQFLRRNDIGIYSAALSAAVPYHDMDLRGSTALIVGTESTGLSSDWLEHSDENIIIPMQGEIDSMNVSVSAAILIFEAKRQRAFK